MTDKKTESAVLIGFIAVSKTTVSRIVSFPIAPGFTKKAAESDLMDMLAKDDRWDGYALAIDPKGKLRSRVVSTNG